MIIVPGSVNADLLFKVAKLPRPGETVLCPSYVMAPGGKGANQAAAALTPLQQAIRVELERLVAGGEEEPDLTRLTRLTRELCLPQRRAG